MILWHATDYDNLDSIMTKGILPGTLGQVYFADNPTSSAVFLYMRGVAKAVALPVHFNNGEVQESHDHNGRFFRCRCYTSDKAVGPDRILWDKAKVYNLDETRKQVQKNA